MISQIFRTKRAFSYSPENLKNISWFTNYVHLWLSQNISYHHNLSAIFERLTCLDLRSYFIFDYVIFNILLFEHKVRKSENQQKCLHRVLSFMFSFMFICKCTDQIRIFQINQSIHGIIDGSANLLIFEHIFMRQIGVEYLTNSVIKSRRQEQIVHNKCT